MSDPTTGSEEWLEQIRRKAGAIKYGQLTLTIHDGRVVQLEVSEKTRFSSTTAQNHTDNPWQSM